MFKMKSARILFLNFLVMKDGRTAFVEACISSSAEIVDLLSHGVDINQIIDKVSSIKIFFYHLREDILP